MPSVDTPTRLEKMLSYLISIFLPPLGILIAIVYYVRYPPGLRTLARNCIVISIGSMALVTLAVIAWDFLLK